MNPEASDSGSTKGHEVQLELIDGDLDFSWEVPVYIPRVRMDHQRCSGTNALAIGLAALAVASAAVAGIWTLQRTNVTPIPTIAIVSAAVVPGTSVAEPAIFAVAAAGIDIDGGILDVKKSSAPPMTGKKTPAVVVIPAVRISSADDISRWTHALNRYLVGTPLEGRGEAFARAAFHSGIDPRLSVAISQIESQRGRYTPKNSPYNYWGYTSVHGGYRIFSGPEEAISEHAAYIARVYGKNATPEAISRKYCPPNWKYWQQVVRLNMEKIL